MLIKEGLENGEALVLPESVVPTEGSDLSAEVGNGAGEEGVVRESVVQ